MPNERIPRRQYESQVGKTRLKGLITKVLHILARNTPFPHLRVTLYRWMGIHIGRQVSIGLDSYLDDQFAMAMSFEDDCRLEARITTVVHDDAGLSPAGPGSIFKQGPLTLGHVAPITIRRGAIIQARAALLPGIIVGERAIVRPGAVVTRDVPPCSVVAGAPAKVICSWQRDSHSQSPSPGADDEPSRSQPPSPGAPSRERDLEQVDFSRQQERKEEPNMSLLPPNYILRAEYDAQVRKSWFRLAYQYLMLCLARFTLPTKLRVALYRAMGANVGRDVYIGVDTYLDERYPELITFEDDSGPSFRSIYVTHGETYDAEGTRIRYVAPIRVKRGAWSGSNTVVCPGVTIGEGAVVGSGSVITEDVPDYAVVVGNPAQVIKYRTPPQQEPAAESKRR